MARRDRIRSIAEAILWRYFDGERLHFVNGRIKKNSRVSVPEAGCAKISSCSNFLFEIEVLI